ncbi:MAG: cytochrome c maturation protein CcmE [Anaerolineales bacterium]|nr:cytochrome c maturation protein CcmE [Anaerolineales bacterium]
MENTINLKAAKSGRTKFIVGGLLIISAIIYLIISSTLASAQFFLTVDELKAKGSEIIGRDVRISGAVLGDTIHYDRDTDTLTFTIVHMPGDNNEINAQGGLAAVLHEAVNDPSRQQLTVVSKNPPPDLLRHEAQAIVTGKLGEDGMFYANELLLRCPTKYEEAVPAQVEG